MSFISSIKKDGENIILYKCGEPVPELLISVEDVITIGFLDTETTGLDKLNDQVIELEGMEKKYVLYRKPNIPKHDALKEEFIHFAKSIQNTQKPETDGESAAQALSLALEINKLINI